VDGSPAAPAVKIQYQPHLIVGCLAATGLGIEAC
jgi:hypothetical protein